MQPQRVIIFVLQSKGNFLLCRIFMSLCDISNVVGISFLTRLRPRGRSCVSPGDSLSERVPEDEKRAYLSGEYRFCVKPLARYNIVRIVRAAIMVAKWWRSRGMSASNRGLPRPRSRAAIRVRPRAVRLEYPEKCTHRYCADTKAHRSDGRSPSLG